MFIFIFYFSFFSGALMSFMLHDVVGWNPTIEDILVSARTHSAVEQENKSSFHIKNGITEDYSTFQHNHTSSYGKNEIIIF